jgi:hypothetical protein
MSEKSEKAAMARKYSEATTDRKRRKRASELWRKLRYEGHGSIEEMRREAEELGLPETWQGAKMHENVTADDLPPSRRVIETLARDLKKSKKTPSRNSPTYKKREDSR